MRHELLTDRNLAEELVDSRQLLLRIPARRPDDLFVAEVICYNLKVRGTPPALVRVEPGRDAALVLKLPPQSFAEEAFLDATGDVEQPGEPAEPLPVLGSTRLRMSGPTYLAFAMPDAVESLPYTLDAVLQACRSWSLRRSFTAAPEPAPGMAQVGGAQALLDVSTSAEFTSARRVYVQVLRDLSAPGADAAVNDAGQRLAERIRAGSAVGVAGSGGGRRLPQSRSDPETVLLASLRLEVARIGRRYPSLMAGSGKAVLSMAIVHEALAALAAMGPSVASALEAVQIPLVSAVLAPYRPTGRVTSIELPYRLLLSPIGSARFTHRTAPLVHAGRSELWHTRLTIGSRNHGVDAGGKVRAIWSEDYLIENLAPTTNTPFRMSLDAQDRQMLVKLTSGFQERSLGIVPVPYVPRPASARRLTLSALGGALDVQGVWPIRPLNVDIEQWRHLAGLGRDQYVRVVTAGFLMPFGHAASLIKVTERKFEPTNASTPLIKRVATLRQRFFLVVRESVRTMVAADHVHGGHPFPFTSVELLTRVTPNLLAPDNPMCRVIEGNRTIYNANGVTGGLAADQLFWPMVHATPDSGNFRFDIAAIDRDGRKITFSLPLLFMSEIGNTGQVTKGAVTRDRIQNIIDGYNAETAARRETSLDGASVCYAPRGNADRQGDPRIPTQSMRFLAGDVSSTRTTHFNSYPEVDQSRVALRPVQRILGRADALVTVGYHATYAEHGFEDENPGEVFLELRTPSGGWDMEFGAEATASRTDAVGAVASPTMDIRGISRLIGVAGDLERVRENTFDPAQYFANARLLGGIRIRDVITDIVPVDGDRAPQFVTRELPAGGGLPARTESRFDWQTTLDSADPFDILIPRADNANDSPFRMLALTTTPDGSPGDSTSTATATIGNFKVNLFGFIVLWFRELSFTAERGRKPDVKVDLHPTRGVEFGGPLEFVNQLKDLLPGNGFSDPSALSVTPSGISSSFTLGIPSVQVGIFALSGLSVGARFSLPFDTQPVEVGFNFAERENPFSLTVSLLGGGGFLAIGIGADGVREIEAALEAGARLAIDLGVASGSVEIKAGIYFHWLTGADGKGGLVELAGYVRLHGELDVMGLISASLTFNLQLAYRKEGSRSVIWGEATLTIEIEVLLFSGEVSVRCRREFGGSEADPTFAQLTPGAPIWSEYCLAFAEN